MARPTNLTMCSFCGKAHSEVRKLIAGPGGVFICDDCVSRCKTLLDKELAQDTKKTTPQVRLLKPSEIKRRKARASKSRNKKF